MTKALKLPLGVTKDGGAATIEGDDVSHQLILTALSDNDNDNAFQQGIGLGSGAIFEQPNAAIRGKILRRLLAIFRDFERAKRFKLVRSSLTIAEVKGQGETNVEFSYFDLETDEVKTFRRRFQR